MIEIFWFFRARSERWDFRGVAHTNWNHFANLCESLRIMGITRTKNFFSIHWKSYGITCESLRIISYFGNLREICLYELPLGDFIELYSTVFTSRLFLLNLQEAATHKELYRKKFCFWSCLGSNPTKVSCWSDRTVFFFRFQYFLIKL